MKQKVYSLIFIGSYFQLVYEYTYYSKVNSIYIYKQLKVWLLKFLMFFTLPITLKTFLKKIEYLCHIIYWSLVKIFPHDH